MNLQLEVFEFVCSNCADRYRAPQVVVGDYLLMRSEGLGTLSVIRTVDNPLLDEVDKLISDLPVIRGYSDYRIGRAGQSAFSVVYDRDVDGTQFVMGGLPRCPVCGWSNPSEWSAPEPLVFVEMDLPEAAHVEWDHMDLTAKRAPLIEAIGNALSS